MSDLRESEYIVRENDYVGPFPIRQDITVLPADDPKRSKIGWVVKEYVGTEISRCYKNWVDTFTKVLKENGNFADLFYKGSIKKLKGIKVGDTVLCYALTGIVETTITEVDYKAKSGTAETECMTWLLEFGGDDRESWISTCQISKSAIEKLKLDITEEGS